MSLASIADNSIVQAQMSNVLLNKDYDTGDIMHAVLNVYKKHWQDVKEFAPSLKGSILYQTCSNVWHFVKKHIRYVKDPKDNQWVRSPKRLWHDKQGDCKSYSVFIAALLKCLDIPCIIRFVSFERYNSHPTHVYVIVMDGGKEIVLDCVVNAFNVEAPYVFKFDYLMKGLYEMNGVPGVNGGLATLFNSKNRKDVLWAALPELSILFIYLYIPEGKWQHAPNAVNNYLTNAPQAVIDKRKKAYHVSWDWGQWAGIRVQSDLYPKIRQYITQRLGMEPQEFWNQVMKWQITRNDNGVYGIFGDEAAAATTTATTTTTNTTSTGSNVAKYVSTAKGIWASLGKLFGGANLQFTYPIDQFAPDESDWPQYQGNALVSNPVRLYMQKLGVNTLATTTPGTVMSPNPYNVAMPDATPTLTKVFDAATGLFKDAAGTYYNIDNIPVDPATGKPFGTANAGSSTGYNASLGSTNMWLTLGIAGAAAFLLLRGSKGQKK